jgi:lysophospholipase L1-like esterase
MLRRLTCTVIVAALTLVGLAAPAGAATARTQYLALGDSLAFGYQPNGVFDQGYVQQLHAMHPDLALTNLGCPGETSQTLVAGGKCPGASQLQSALTFLKGHRHQVRLITIDIGGNDVNRCVSLATGIDQNCFRQALFTLGFNLFVTVAALRHAAPDATIVGMTYYDTVLAAYLVGPAGQALAQQSLPLSHQFNGLLTFIYRLGGFRVADVAGAFETDNQTVVNGIPVDVARICQWTWMCTKTDIHANTAGYGVIARAFEAML